MPNKKSSTKEFHREIDHGPNKLHLILQFSSGQFPAGQFPPACPPPPPKDALRREIHAILSRELSGKAFP